MKFLQILIVFIMLTLSVQGQHKSSVAQAFHDLIEKEWEFRQQEFPSMANEKAELNAFPEVTPAAYERRANFWQSILDSLEHIDKRKLSTADQINYDIFKYQLENKVALINFEDYLMPINAEGGFYSDLGMIPRYTSFESVQDYKNYLNKLSAIKKYMKDHIDLMRIGIEKGITQPKVIVANYKTLLQPFLTDDVDSSVFYEPFQNFAPAVPESKYESLREEAKKVIEGAIFPAYEAFNVFMAKEYLPAARETLGATELPYGDHYYRQRVQYFTTLPVTAEEVYATGLKEVDRIKSEMEGIIEEVGFEGSFAQFLDFLRNDPQFYVDTPEELLKEASYIAKNIDGKLPRYFNTLPRLPYGVEPVPEAIAPTYTSGRYSGGSWKNHKAGKYWVNTYNLDSRTLYTLPALTLHEAVPGHHLQISLAQEMKGLPEFRKHGYISAFGEGWGLYAEYLGIEAGMYKTPYEHFGRLTYEMWRACRLVIDVGIHAKGWSREKAVEYLASNTALSLHEVNTEIDRYIGWPGQALSYKMGEIKIRELRKKAETALKDKFNIREFHDAVLKNGSVPLFVLEDVIEAHIEEKLKKSED